MKKIRYNRLFIIGIGLYTLFTLTVDAIESNIDTMVLEKEEVELKINTKGLFLREEYLINLDTEGKVEFLVDDNTKVANDEIIALINTDKIKIDNNKNEVDKLDQELETLKNSLDKSVSDIQKKVIQNNINEKENQLEILKKLGGEYTHEIKAPSSGIISYEYDNNEDKYTLETINNIEKQDIQNEVNNYIGIGINDNNIKYDEPIMRIIKSNSNYLIISLSEEENELMKDKNTITIKNENMNIMCEIDEIYKKQDYYIYKLKIREENIQIYDTRVSEFDIIYKKANNIKINKNCIVEEKGKIGVYKVDSETNKIYFVEIKGKIYEDKEYMYVDYEDNILKGIDSIEIYDEIIINPNYINKNIMKSR